MVRTRSWARWAAIYCREGEMRFTILCGLVSGLAALPGGWANGEEPGSRPGFAGPAPLQRRPHSVAMAQARDRAAAQALARAHGAGQRLAAPEILSGKIISAVLNVAKAPALPEFSISYKAPGAIDYVSFGFFSPSGQYYSGIFYFYAPSERAGTLLVSEPDYQLNLYSEPGVWTLSYIDIVDDDGSYAFYTTAELATLFPSNTMRVVNTVAPDVVPPTVLTAKILTPKVSAGGVFPWFEAVVVAADNLSGFDYIDLLLQEPNGDIGYPASEYSSAPSRKGAIVVGEDLSYATGSGLGTWTITGYQACDLADNCVTDTNAADVKKLFGNVTFEVTK
jgi:hypothetical protein